MYAWRHFLTLVLLVACFSVLVILWLSNGYSITMTSATYSPYYFVMERFKNQNRPKTQFDRYHCLSEKVSPAIGNFLKSIGNNTHQHIAFSKVHKSASTTLQNIFYRYGFLRNLSFVLPKRRDLRFSLTRGEHAEIFPALGNKTKYDILANHAVFDEQILSSMLHKDTIYIGIMREPTRNFISAAFYAREVIGKDYLKLIPDEKLLPLLIRFPEQYESQDLRTSYTYNVQANDLGLPLDRIKRIDDKEIDEYLTKLNKIFSLILIADYFDESVVLMKRYLNWEWKDIMYLKKNEFSKPQRKLTTTEERILKERNYLDYKFYNFFHKRFWIQMSCERSDIMEEVKQFQQVRNDVTVFCSTNRENPTGQFTIKKNKWNRSFNVSSTDCQLMRISERRFYQNLCRIQSPLA